MEAAEHNLSYLTGLRVLIVEDEPMLAFCLGEVLEDEGCLVVGIAGTVSEALEAAARATFDVAILDLNLHGLPVDSIAEAIVGGGRAIVFSTGSRGSVCPPKFQGWPVLHKPYRDEAVFAALRSVVDAPPHESRDG